MLHSARKQVALLNNNNSSNSVDSITAVLTEHSFQLVTASHDGVKPHSIVVRQQQKSNSRRT